MSTTREYIDFVCECVHGCGAVRCRKMFGEYMVYIEERPLLLVCDNTVYVKKHPALEALLSGAPSGTPYEGAREHYLLDIENPALCQAVIDALLPLTPLPVRKPVAKPPYQSPTETGLETLIGAARAANWRALCAQIDALYDMERQWNSGGRKWAHEYKYRRGGKTLCALYARRDEAGFMVILGAAERERFETQRNAFAPAVQRCYDEAATHHDGKWIMLPLCDAALLPDYLRLLAIKRRPTRPERLPKTRRES